MRVICRNIHTLYCDTGITCIGDMGGRREVVRYVKTAIHILELSTDPVDSFRTCGGSGPFPHFMRSNDFFFKLESLLGFKAWRGRSTSVLKTETLIKQPRSRCQRSETPVGAHLQIVAEQIQDFQATLRWSVSLRELAATSYLRRRMDFIIALAVANLL